jgi:hypothetical protein
VTRTILRVDNDCVEETKPHAIARRLIDQRQTTHPAGDITLLNFAIWLLSAKAADVATSAARSSSPIAGGVQESVPVNLNRKFLSPARS